MATKQDPQLDREQTRKKVQFAALVLFILCALFWGLVHAKPFLAPIVIASLLTMLVLPISLWLEKRGFKRGWSALVCDLILIAFAGLLGTVVFIQAKSIGKEWPAVKERLRPQVEYFQNAFEFRTGITVEQQNAQTGIDDIFGDTTGADALARSAQTQEDLAPPAEDSKVLRSAGDLLWGSLKFFATAVLVFIYVFFFLLYRHKFTHTILLLVPKNHQTDAREAINMAGKVSQNYLLGRLMLILCLSVFYAIGFSLSGIDHAILISVLAGFLSLMPYVGNALALLMAISMSFFSGGGITEAFGVIITYFVAQFIESYILEPYLIGNKVDLNPVMVIIAVILGSVVWGVAGMALAIPALGITKVVCDHVPMLRPFAYLFGQETSPRKLLHERFKRGR